MERPRTPCSRCRACGPGHGAGSFCLEGTGNAKGSAQEQPRASVNRRSCFWSRTPRLVDGSWWTWTSSQLGPPADSDLQPTRTSRPEAQSWAPLMGLRLELNSLRYQVWPDYQCSQTHTHLLDSGHNFYSFPSPPPSAPVSRAGEVHGGRVPPVVHILPRGLTGAWSSQRL